MPFFVIFVIIPFVEIMVFMAVGEHVGIFTTLMLALLTAILGGMIVRHQGLQTILSMRNATEAGKMPLNEIFDGFCLVAAGAMLITPGFVTDAIGFSLLIPPFRALLKTAIKNHTSWHFEAGDMHAPRRPHDPNVIEGEYDRLDEE